MPEGDTLYKIAGFLRERAVGHLVERAQLLAAPAPELARRRVLAVDVHGKHLLISLSPPSERGWCLRVHLGMYGAWHAYPRGARWQRPAWQASVVIDMGGVGTFVCFAAEHVSMSRLPAHPTPGSPTLVGLGAQLLRAQGASSGVRNTAAGAKVRSPWAQQLTLAALDDDLLDILDALAARPKDTIAADLLLDQRIAAGFGNVYKSEILFLFGVHPLCPIACLSPWVLASMFARGRNLLQQNVGGWPRTTTVDRRRLRLPRGMPRLWAYNRAEQPCLLCGHALRRALLGRHRRSTFWCPHCQAEGRVPAADHVARIHSANVALQQTRDIGALAATQKRL